MSNRDNSKNGADDDTAHGIVEADINSSDIEDEFRDGSEGSDEIHLFQKLFGVACLLAVFLLFMIIVAPTLAPLLQVVL